MKTIAELFDFKGKVIIISGAAGAIGSEASRFFGSLGANVVLGDLNEEGVKKIAEEITKESGNEALGLKIDATDEDQIQLMIDKTIEKFGKISGVINNVGWGANTPLWGSDSQKMIDAYNKQFQNGNDVLQKMPPSLNYYYKSKIAEYLKGLSAPKNENFK